MKYRAFQAFKAFSQRQAADPFLHLEGLERECSLSPARPEDAGKLLPASVSQTADMAGTATFYSIAEQCRFTQPGNPPLVLAAWHSIALPAFCHLALQ